MKYFVMLVITLFFSSMSCFAGRSIVETVRCPVQYQIHAGQTSFGLYTWHADMDSSGDIQRHYYWSGSGYKIQPEGRSEMMLILGVSSPVRCDYYDNEYQSDGFIATDMPKLPDGYLQRSCSVINQNTLKCVFSK